MTKPYQYQKDGVLDMEDFLSEGGGALLADDMGLGKTFQALALMHRETVGPMFPALVVCPATVKYTWEHEALVHIRMRAQVLESQTPPTGTIGIIPKLMIINPDILRFWVPYLRKIGLQTLVIDECQQFGNLGAKWTKAMIEISRMAPYRVAMSGTPLLNRPAELWPTLHMLRPDVWPSFFAYAQEHCRPKREYGKWTYKGATNLPALHAKLRRTCMIRRLKEDVLHDLPDKVRSVVPMALSSMAEYVDARDNFVSWLRRTYDRDRADRAVRAEAVTQIGYLLRLAAQLKCRSVVEWVNRWLEAYPTEKIVLFAVHRKMIGVLQRRVQARSVTVDGSVVGRRRKLAVDTFRHDPEHRVFIGNIKAAGTGVDGLQHVCNTMAFCELWWRPGDHIQAEDRLYRIGQNVHVWINYLIACGTIEEHLCRVVQEKQGVIRATLDGGAVPSDLDIWDQLINIIRNENNATKTL